MVLAGVHQAAADHGVGIARARSVRANRCTSMHDRGPRRRTGSRCALRIAVVSSFSHSVGGVETYLESLLPKLVERRHTVGLWHEYAAPSSSRSIVPAGVQTCHIG